MYASLLLKINGSSLFIFKWAFIPAISPWQAASSYPVVPLIWPAKNRFCIFFVSNVAVNWVGGKKSYSIAYPGRNSLQFSKPGTNLNALIWVSSERLVENPFTYISTVLKPSGSTNNWCLSLSANLLILSSILGQYLGPEPLILPWYIGLCSNPVLKSSCTAELV